MDGARAKFHGKVVGSARDAIALEPGIASWAGVWDPGGWESATRGEADWSGMAARWRSGAQGIAKSSAGCGGLSDDPNRPARGVTAQGSGAALSAGALDSAGRGSGVRVRSGQGGVDSRGLPETGSVAA